MKYFKVLMVFALLLAVVPVSAQKKKSAKAAKPQKVLKEPKEPKVLKPVYIFGIAASFTDTVVYYTDIQLLDSVHLNGHGFLPQRELYSYQLKNYLEYDKQIPNHTCMVYFANNRSDLDKQYSRVMNKYKKSSDQVLELIDPKEFQFKKPEY
ncbi:MAG: hypothetical protein LIP08_10175 [Bacteroides sp.]|nr:hypothetical protein [Bacteroides sp.]